MRSNPGNRFGGSISRSIFIRFFAALAGYTAAIVAVFFAAAIVLSQFAWHPENVLYQIFKAIANHSFEFILLCVLIGFAAIFIFYWRKTLGFIDAVVGASEALAEKGDGVIELPVELRQVEIHMNQAKHDALRGERLLREAEQRKNDMVMYLAHDIRTPLTSVIGYLSLLEEAPDMPREQRAKYTSITLDKAYRLERLIDEFFEITRYNFQTMELAAQSIDLGVMLGQMADEFYPLLAAKAKRAVLAVPEDMRILGDPDKLARVFNNILKNAVAYGPEHTDIEITATDADGKARVAFKSAGGIPKDKLVSIFDKFFRLDSARSSDTGGSGLGLAIAKEIVHTHGGRIWAESDGQNTCFTVELPMAGQ